MIKNVHMINAQKNNFQYSFSVNGGDARSSKFGLGWPLFWISSLSFGYGQYGITYVPKEWQNYGWLSIILCTLLIIVLFLRSLSNGALARFVVKIDLETAEISAYDRLSSQSLWTTSFFPEQLHISEILIELNGEEYTFPVLVYAEEKLEFVEESVPYPDRAILGYAEKPEIEKILEQINQDIAMLYSLSV